MANSALSSCASAGFIRPAYDVRYLVAREVEEILPMLLGAARLAPEPAALSSGL